MISKQNARFFQLNTTSPKSHKLQRPFLQVSACKYVTPSNCSELLPVAIIANLPTLHISNAAANR